jgi:ABC-type ATPase involved in cell division
LFRRFDAAINGPGFVCVTSDSAHVGTTLLELLVRLRRPHKGQIRLDSHDVRRLNVGSIRRQIGWVDRDLRVVNALGFTIDGQEWSATERRLEAAWPGTQSIAPKGEFSRCVNALRALGHYRWTESRLDSDVRLRFAVCSALLNEPPILLLDDPTRDLSSQGVQHLLDWLREAVKYRLVIVTTNDPRLMAAGDQNVHIPSFSRNPGISDSARRTSSKTREKTTQATADSAMQSFT